MRFPFHKPEKKDTPPRSRYEQLPRVCIVLFALTAVSGLLTLLFRLIPAFADFFNRTVSQALRVVFATITSPLPLSFAELLLLSTPILLTLLIVYAVRRHTESLRAIGVYVLKLLSAVCVFAILFVWMFGAGYYGKTLASPEKLDLDRHNVSAEELYETALHLSEKVREEAQNVEFLEKDFSVMPYSIKEMNQKLLDAYDAFCQKHDFIASFNSRVKPVMLSVPMSYTHITGVYSYFTGEANINVNFPDYTLPFTAAHELAHQRGIAREDEANFIAYLVCLESTDPYIRYSGYLNLYEYVASALYRANPDLYVKVRDTLPIEVRYELIAYSNFFDQYRDSVASDISGAVNDTYLKLQGTEGTRSYGLVVDLAVAYDQKMAKE